MSGLLALPPGIKLTIARSISSGLKFRQFEELAATNRRRYPRHVIYFGHVNQSNTATHTATCVIVKVRPDLLIDSPQRRRTLVDFKTTSCKAP